MIDNRLNSLVSAVRSVTSVLVTVAMIHSSVAFGSPEQSADVSRGGSTFYISADASDGGQGTLDAPWNFRALERPGLVNAGDTVILRGGLYTQNYRIAIEGGEDAPIRLKAADNEVVTFQPANTTYAGLTLDGKYVRLEGIHMRSASETAIAIRGRGIKIVNSFVEHEGSGVLIDALAEDSEIYGNILVSTGRSAQVRSESAAALVVADNIFIARQRSEDLQTYRGPVAWLGNYVSATGDAEGTGRIIFRSESTRVADNVLRGTAVDSVLADQNDLETVNDVGRSPQLRQVVRKNAYDDRRFSVFIEGAGEEVTLDLSEALAPSEAFELKPADPASGDAVIRAIYNGERIRVSSKSRHAAYILQKIDPSMVATETTPAAATVTVAEQTETVDEETNPKSASRMATTSDTLESTTGTYTLKPGDNLQQIVSGAAEGTTFVFTPGVYRMQTINPRNYQKFIGQTGAVMSGAKVLSGWQYDSSRAAWYVTGQTQDAGMLHGVCAPNALGISGYDGCRYRNDLWFGSTLKVQVTNISHLAPGRWYFDYAADRIYVKDDPSSSTVETSVTEFAFYSTTATGVTIQNLVIEKYANNAQYGAIEGGDSGAGNRINSRQVATNWQILNNDIRHNHGGGIRIGSGWTVKNNHIHHNGQIGIAGGGTGSVVEGNEISFNNTSYFDPGWEAGGTKFAWNTNLRVAHNYSHDNKGWGLWTDVDNKYITYEHNQIINNAGPGISHEISFDCVIRYNTIKNNGTDTLWVWHGGVVIQNSSNCVVHNNHVQVRSGAGNGITIVQQYRSSSPSYSTPWVSNNNQVYDNVVKHLGSTGVSGLGGDYDTTKFTASGNNVFSRNMYYLPSLSRSHWHGVRGQLSWSGWSGLPQDSGGKEILDPGIILPVVVLATYLPGGTPGVAYSRTLGATDGTGPYSWSIAAGTLPAGLSLSAAGTISGTPTTAGLYNFTVRVTDSQGRVDTQPFAIAIGGSAAVTSPSPAPTPDTTDPVVSVTSPSAGAVVSGTSVTLAANASDNIGVAGVRFLVNGAQVGSEDTTSPYSVVWNSTLVSDGSYSVTAIARDAAGNTTTSSAVSISVKNTAVAPVADSTAPQVSITSPGNGSTVSGTSVSLAASASDNVGVVGVIFRVNGVQVGSEDTTAPYSVTWNSTAVANGSHSITAIARDAAGNRTTSSAISVTVSNSSTTAPSTTVGTEAFVGQYFGRQDFTDLRMTRTDAAINFDWGTGSPSSTMPSNHFSIRWNGNFTLAAGTYTFKIHADNGVRLYIDNQLVLDKWFDGAPANYTVDRTLSAGTHLIRLDYFEASGGAAIRLGWSNSTVSTTLGQFTGQYFGQRNLTDLKLTRTDAAVNFDWGFGSPHSSIAADDFSARWTGDFNFLGATYVFTVYADNGVRLFIDDVLVLDKWIDVPPTTYQVSRAMTAGAHKIRLEYFEASGGAAVKLSWR